MPVVSSSGTNLNFNTLEGVTVTSSNFSSTNVS